MISAPFRWAGLFWGSVLIAMAVAIGGSAPVAVLESSALQFASRLSAAPLSSENVRVVGIDEPALDAVGPWPWTTEILADLLGVVGEVPAIGLFAPDGAVERAYRLHLGATGGESERPHGDTPTQSLIAISHARSATPLYLSLAPGTAPPPSAATRLSESAIPDWARHIPHVFTRPPAAVAGAAAAPGHALADAIPLMQTLDDLRQGVPLWVEVQEGAVPGLALAIASRISPHAIPVDQGGRMFLRGDGPDVPVVSAARAKQAATAGELAGKVVLVGPTAPGTYRPVILPSGAAVPPVVAEARVLAALLDDTARVRLADWSVSLQPLMMAGVVLYLFLLVPRLGFGTGLATTLLLLVLLVTAGGALLALEGIWLPLATPVALLGAGFPVAALWRQARQRRMALIGELADTNRQLGQALQNAGQLDAALERYRRCPPSKLLLEALYGLGLDYERKRRFSDAAGVFADLAATAPDFRDTRERAQRNREADEGMRGFGAGGASTPTGTLVLADDGGMQKPVLGRYRVERAIGRGAMGLVYEGIDPKIGRTVAIKTMALAQEYESEQLDSVRERFFREAETAGRLNHPHIVTIYDVGEDQELAYIAMDFLKGQDLSHFCTPDALLPVGEVIDIGIQVAEALDYAHQQHVVHRDIKPANIVYDREQGKAMVTDFGVACLTDASKTRTGTILGSPTYMAPEQLAGQKVDGRADLFSLGATLFQLLSGQVPFEGDSFASLVYKIANERHADLGKLRNDLPPCLIRLVNKALSKAPERRYQTGATLAAALRRCRDRDEAEEAACE